MRKVIVPALLGLMAVGLLLLSPADTAAQDSGPQVIATVALGSSDEAWLVRDAAVDPERNRIYVASYRADAEKLFIVDGSTNTVTDTIVAGAPIEGAGVNPTTNRIYLSIEGEVQVIDGETKAVLHRVEGIQGGPVAVDPVANRIFTHDTSGWDDLLVIIDGATNDVSTVKVGSSPSFVWLVPEVNPQTGLLYVFYGAGAQVRVVDPTAKAVVTNLQIDPVAGANALAINPQTNRIYAQTDDETVVVDGSTHSVVARIPGEAGPTAAIAVNPATNRIYRAEGTNIELIDGTTNSLVTTLSWSDEEWAEVSAMAVNTQTNRLYVVGRDHSDAMVVVVQDVGAEPPPPSPPPAQGTIHNCPQPGRWAISVWEGQDGTDTGQALANCAAGAVAAAYFIDPQTQGWSRWFAGRPGVSTLATLDDMQGVLALGGAAVAPGAGSAAGSVSATQASGQMHNCPQPGRWTIAVWNGATGAAPSDALAACGADAVAAAYSLEPQTGAWSRWFAGRPEMSTLETLDSMQGVIALGSLSPPPVAPTPTPTPAVWSDGRIEIILDQVERTQVLPPDVVEFIYTLPPEELPTPAEGHDYVCVYLTIAHIENIHVVDAFGHGDEHSTLSDAEGLSYELALGGVRGIEYLDPHDITSPYEFVEGATGILVFELPVDKKPASLTFVYSFKETWEQATSKRGQVDIGL